MYGSFKTLSDVISSHGIEQNIGEYIGGFM